MRQSAGSLSFNLNLALGALVVLRARIGADASSANRPGAERLGTGIVVGADGLVLTIGYLITEAEEISLTTSHGRQIDTHLLGFDPVIGFGLVNALEPLDASVMRLGDSREPANGDEVVLSGAGGLAHAMAVQLVARRRSLGTGSICLRKPC